MHMCLFDELSHMLNTWKIYFSLCLVFIPFNHGFEWQINPCLLMSSVMGVQWAWWQNVSLLNLVTRSLQVATESVIHKSRERQTSKGARQVTSHTCIWQMSSTSPPGGERPCRLSCPSDQARPVDTATGLSQWQTPWVIKGQLVVSLWPAVGQLVGLSVRWWTG